MISKKMSKYFTVWMISAVLIFGLISPASLAASAEDNVELLRSEYKQIDDKIKVTADVRVQESEVASVLAIGYDKAGNIVEMAADNSFIVGARTEVFELELKRADLIDKVDVKVVGDIDDPYEIIAEASIPHSDHMQVVTALKLGENSETISVVAIGYNKSGKVVEVRGDTNFVVSERIKLYEIKLDAIHEIDHVKVMVLLDGSTYLVEYGTYVKDGRILFTSVVKNGSESQSIMARITPYNAAGKEQSIITDTNFTVGDRVYNLKKEIRDPQTSRVDVKFYDESGKVEITKRDALVTIDGESLATEQPPANINGSILVPMRAIFEALGAELQWEQATQKITAVKGTKEIKLQIGSDVAYIDGTETKLVAKPELIEGHTMVPVRFVSEALDADVFWDNRSKTVIITR